MGKMCLPSNPEIPKLLKSWSELLMLTLTPCYPFLKLACSPSFFFACAGSLARGWRLYLRHWEELCRSLRGFGAP